MKDHKKVERRVLLWELEGSVASAINYLEHTSEGFVDPCVKIESSGWPGGDIDYEIVIVGWVPMTEKEKQAATQERKKERERRKRAKEAKHDDAVRYLHEQAKKLGFEVTER